MLLLLLEVYFKVVYRSRSEGKKLLRKGFMG